MAPRATEFKPPVAPGSSRDDISAHLPPVARHVSPSWNARVRFPGPFHHRDRRHPFRVGFLFPGQGLQQGSRRVLMRRVALLSTGASSEAAWRLLTTIEGLAAVRASHDNYGLQAV